MTSQWLEEASITPVRRSKGEGTECSDYIKLAKQGGHKNLLVIEENIPSPGKKIVQRDGGDWFAHGPNENSYVKENIPEVKPKAKEKDHNRSTTDALPGGREQVQRCGKKRFQAPTREPPFATLI